MSESEEATHERLALSAAGTAAAAVAATAAAAKHEKSKKNVFEFGVCATATGVFITPGRRYTTGTPKKRLPSFVCSTVQVRTSTDLSVPLWLSCGVSCSVCRDESSGAADSAGAFLQWQNVEEVQLQLSNGRNPGRDF